jgi:Uma2 family endonuclease
MTPAEYLAWERAQSEKHEYFHGEVFAMAGGSPRHNLLCANAIARLRDLLAGRGCYVLSSDQRIAVDDGERYVYPDVSVICGGPVVQHDDVITNPMMIVEVLSRSTEQNDRGSKWESYRRLSSLSDYVLIPQWSRRVEHFRRDDHGSWSYRVAEAGQRLVLSNGVELVVDELFEAAMELPGDLPPPLVAK